MAEIAKFVHRGAGTITPKILEGVHKQLPYWKLKFAELDDLNYPHLSEQLEFLAALVEDFAEGAEDTVPYTTIAAATFALIYANREVDLIPDSIPEFGHADDSSVVRVVLIENEKILANYAQRHKMDWTKVTLKP
jgi:uncharacterized membrane protein YkvA (DUF1232 family)